VKVEVWSDIACPWCYIGKRRFARALVEFERRDRVEVVWRSYQLAPDAPARETRPHDALLAAKFGIPREQVAPMHARLAAEGAKEGIAYDFASVRMENTFDAHRLVQHATGVGRSDATLDRLYAAYFEQGEHVGSHDVLVRLAKEVGLDPVVTGAMLASDQYAADVRTDQARAREFGITGVPFFAIDERYGIAGAQPADAIVAALRQAAAAS